MTGESTHLIPLTGEWSLWRTAVVRSAGLPFGILDRFALPSLLERPPSQQRSDAIRHACTQAVAALVTEDVFREAIRWQNPGASGTWLGTYASRIAAGECPKLANRAYRESVVARYAQRYCAKNESIGFFGPVAWARFGASGTGLRQHGSGGIRRRTAFLETWAVAAIAEAWRHDPRLFPYLPVTLDPATTFADGALYRPQRRPQPCEPGTAALLTAAERYRRVGDLLAATGAEPQALLRLHERGIIRIGFRVPFQARPEAHLRQQVAELPPAAPREELLATLDELSALRDALAAARGPDAVDAALSKLTRRLAEAGCQEAAAPRHSSYARTPAYLDCRRDLDVTIGADLLDALRAPLGILLGSARWLASEVAEAVSAGLRERYRWLRARRDRVTLSDLQFATADILSAGGPVAAEIAGDFQSRWAEILPATSHAGTAQEVRLCCAEVGPLADTLFQYSPLRWAVSRYHSPDLLLCRRADGSMQWVLGELHVALNTMESRVFLTQSDEPAELISATAADLRAGRVVPLYPLDAPEATSRTHPPPALDPPGLYRYWSYTSDEGHPDGAESLPATAITVEEEGGELIGYARGRGWAAPVLEFFGDFLTAVAVDLFRIRPPAAHQPRLVLDDMIIARQSWLVSVDEVALPSRNTADRGYQRVCDWAAAQGLPRHVFAQTAAEPKPFYVDFTAPILVGNFVRAVRRARSAGIAELTVTEMLPAPDQLWLSDHSGRRYTAEFRLVAVDRQDSSPVVRTISPVATRR